MDTDSTDERQDHAADDSGQMTSTPSKARSASPDAHTESPTRRKGSTRKRLKKAALDLVAPGRPSHASGRDKPSLNHVRLDAAFNPSKVENEVTNGHSKAERLTEHGRAAVHDGVNFARNPKEAIKSRIKQSATSRFTPVWQPYASKADELKFLESLESAQSTDAGTDGEADSRIRGERLEERRDSIRTAWITSHLRRVRVMRGESVSPPSRESCKYWDEKQQASRTDWLQWLGHVILYLTQSFTPLYIDRCEELPYDLVSMRTHLERFVLASSHWQAWAMDVRSVYRWEDPKRTARWLALYTVLWYTSYVMSFLWAYIIYHVMSNRFQKRTLRNVREAAQRAMDHEKTAYQLGEMIDRLGQEGAIDELLRDLGPYAQLQLDDLANALEVLYNFYAWKSPQKTIWTLSFFASCLACSVFTDTEYCMKIVWFILGASFFFCWPISSNYPQYRLLVSPLKWIFWGIPSHANLSFVFLRKHAELKRQEEHRLEHYAGRISVDDPSQDHMLEALSDDDSENWESAVSDDSGVDEGELLSFRAQCEGRSGHMYVSSDGVRFDCNHPREQLWKLRWKELDEIWKAGVQGHRKVTMRGLFSSGILQLKSTDGHVHTLDPIKYRDQAFNCIIGFSRLQWAVVQTEPGKGRRPKEKQSS